MKRNIELVLGFTLVALVVFPIFIPSVTLAEEKNFTFRYSNFFPAPHKNSQLSEAWCKEVEKRTSGRVKFTYFPGGTLIPPPQTYDSIVNGIADVGMSVLGYTRGKFPLMDALNQPHGYRSGYIATKCANEFYQKFKPKELDEVKIMYLHGHGPGLLHSKKLIEKLGDVSGMKVRASGNITKIVHALGGSPVGTSMPETYDALRTGIAEGAMAPYEALSGWKWGEIITSTTECYPISYTDIEFVAMNKDKWNSLSPDIQATIEQINEEWIERQGKLWDQLDKEGKEFTISKGNKIMTLSEEEGARWKEKVQPIIEEYIKTTKEKGLPAEEAVKFVREYLQDNQK
jgi:TRAP-type transport system periplasmic protein